MTAGADFVSYDFEAKALVFDTGISISLAALGLGVEPTEILSLEFEIVDVFDDPSGKYNQVFGNTVFVDCAYIFT